MDSPTSILVTGGAGSIGLEVCNQLSERGLHVVLFDLPEQVLRVKAAIGPHVTVFYGSVLDPSAVRDAMHGRDAVVHLAAMLGVKRTESNQLRCLDINVTGTQAVLAASAAAGIRKFVFASSSEVYGEPSMNPVGEGLPAVGANVYAVSKLAGEQLCKAYSQHYPHMRNVILRYFNVYGSYQAAHFVVPRFVARVLRGQSPIIHGAGDQVRSYCYAADAAAGTVSALLSDVPSGEAFNIGNGNQPLSLSELARLVIRVAQKESEMSPLYQADFTFTDRSEGREIFERYCDTSKARQFLDYEPNVGIEEGIRRMLDEGVVFERWDHASPDELEQEMDLS